jgi:hypothetical protein
VQSLGTAHGVTVLEHSRRAVKALVQADAPFLDLISLNLADLIRCYDYTDESAHRVAGALIQDVIERSYLFTSEHIRNLCSAFDSACSLRELLLGGEAEFAATLEPFDEPFDDLLTDDCLELLNRTPDFSSESDDIPEFVDNCDNEASERVMELLRSLDECL